MKPDPLYEQLCAGGYIVPRDDGWCLTGKDMDETLQAVIANAELHRQNARDDREAARTCSRTVGNIILQLAAVIPDFERRRLGARLAASVLEQQCGEFVEVMTIAADIYTPVELAKWLDSPQPMLDNLRPHELLMHGRIGELLRILRAMDEGAYI